MPNVGDLVPKYGPYTNEGVITEKKDDGQVIVDTEPLMIHKYHKYSNTTGLNHAEKLRFNEILDEIYTEEDDLQKLNEIQQEIDRLKTDPEGKNILKYLRNQQSKLIRKVEKLPRYYVADGQNIIF